MKSRKSYLLTAALHNCKCFTGKRNETEETRGAQSLLKIQYMYYYEGGRQKHGPATARKVINEETKCGNMQQGEETQ